VLNFDSILFRMRGRLKEGKRESKRERMRVKRDSKGR